MVKVINLIDNDDNIVSMSVKKAIDLLENNPYANDALITIVSTLEIDM